MSFTPKFADLVRCTTTVQGTGAAVLGAPVAGYRGFAEVCQAGDQFYYCIQGTDKPAETEVGRGTMLANGTIERSVPSGALTKFTGGNKTIALVAAAEWFASRDTAATPSGSTASRAALAAMTGMADGTVMRLDEARRGGCFRFVAADLRARVAADTQQGLYVAPASDATGASGAWVRQHEGKVHADWFGLIANQGTDGPGADCLAAFNAMMAILDVERFHPFASWYRMLPIIEFGPGQYFFSKRIDLKGSVHLKGAGGIGGGATMLTFAADQGGITVCRGGTLDADGNTVTGDAGGSIIEGFYVYSVGGTRSGVLASDLMKSGVRVRSRCTIRDCKIAGFVGVGICNIADTSAATTDPFAGNSNGSRFSSLRIDNCKTGGLFSQGGDANACLFEHVDIYGCGRFGVWEQSFLGNAYVGIEVAHCGQKSVTGIDEFPVCTFAGRWYMLHYAATKAQAQSTTPGTDESVWTDLGDNAEVTDAPTWTASNSTNWVPGGVYGGAANFSSFTGCYFETGYAIPNLGPGALIVGGFMAARNNSATHLRSGGNGLVSNNSINLAFDFLDGHSATVRLGGKKVGNMIDLLTWNSYNATSAYDPDRYVGFVIDRASNDLMFSSGGDSFYADLGFATPVRLCASTTARTYGASTADAAGALEAHKLALGNGNAARLISMGSAPPASGAHGLGERLFNDESATPLTTVDYWLCAAAGTPGTWVAVKTGPAAVSTQGGAAYTATLADQGGYIRFTSESGATFTVPSNASVALPVGAEITVEQAGQGPLTIAGAAGVAVNSRGADMTLAGQYAVAVLKQVATDSWTLAGDL